jgi:hypothetical protein
MDREALNVEDDAAVISILHEDKFTLIFKFRSQIGWFSHF